MEVFSSSVCKFPTQTWQGISTRKFQALTKVRDKASSLIFFLAGWTAPLKLAVNGPYRRVTLYLIPLKTQLVLRPKNFNQTGTKRKPSAQKKERSQDFGRAFWRCSPSRILLSFHCRVLYTQCLRFLLFCWSHILFPHSFHLKHRTILLISQLWPCSLPVCFKLWDIITFVIEASWRESEWVAPLKV